jgi:uncharacterized protein (TIGR03084 family)
VRDQISHLAFFDDAAASAITEPDRFRVMADGALELQRDPMEEHLRRGRAMTGADVCAWWDTAHTGMVDAAATLQPDARVPWFGPPMGAMSFVSARIMETWAHGQDVADALGVVRIPTARLRHVAHLGVRARPFSYVVRGRRAPTELVSVRLIGPSGETWTWDTEDDPPNRVSGPAIDFCLVVTQRRNVADTALEVEGALAEEWLSIAQAFAGPPGPGRPPAR